MGGSGGGGRDLSKQELNDLETIAKRAMRPDGESARKNVFISFAAEDLNAVNLLRGQAKNENVPLEFNDYSLKEPFDSDKAEYIKRGIRERINQSSVTICYVSDKTADSSWVDWEIRESISLGKAVIGVYSGSCPSRLPKAMSDHKITIVPWEHKKIMQAIDRQTKMDQ